MELINESGFAANLAPADILQAAGAKGVEKANTSLYKLAVLSFLGGLYIACGYLLCLRVGAVFPAEWGSVGSFVGACLFPVGLIAIVLGGGELITGNMLLVTVALAQRKIRVGQALYNWGVVTLGNLAGAVAAAWFFGHVVGLTEGSLMDWVATAALAKTRAGMAAAFVSGVGCNIFVGLAVWLSLGARSASDKILCIWFPVMTFVAIGFQHVVANMFVIPAAIFGGLETLSWLDFAWNLVVVFLGNLAGGALLGLLYQRAYRRR